LDETYALIIIYFCVTVVTALNCIFLSYPFTDNIIDAAFGEMVRLLTGRRHYCLSIICFQPVLGYKMESFTDTLSISSSK